ncbi:unnamed protein product [Acanthoscelides obtectus]|uniref:Glucosidase II subunit alpha n=1 Tax=Acanthoscelides obtectus TaxID=200917 RepID=A0A9P0K1M9_ACAOB|nr:unnamed protein product [Acanthoscelides obtectus]CAK1670015.1 Neutral alpha-glucosidase AB [Acanthoscelides obtectus]
MIRWYIILGVLAAFTIAADHTLFKTCEKVGVCQRLRNTTANELFKIENLKPTTAGNVTNTWQLSRGTDKFTLTIELLNNAKVRFQLKEEGSKRYELKDVLDENQPQPIKVKVEPSQDEKKTTITPDPSTKEQHSIVIYKEPLKVAFLYNEKELVVLDSTNLVMEYKNGKFDEKDVEIKDIGFNVIFSDALKLYGLHHHAYNLELPDTSDMEPFRLRNSDTANFEANSPMALYGSVPVIYGHSNSSTTGIFLHNAAEQWVDIRYTKDGSPSAHFMVDSGSFDLFVMLGPNIENVVQQFTDLTGKAQMPQLWTLGYHQCRWSYFTREEVLGVVKNMNEGGFPLDAIWLDIDYTDGKKYFTWSDKFTGTDGKGVETMLETLKGKNKKLVTIIDPHIKVDEKYPVYKEGKDGNYFVKEKDGKKDFVGECWPGNSSYVDFLNPAARTYYANHYSDREFHQGYPEVLAGIWNDMNEPSVFDPHHEWTMPFDNKHKSTNDGEAEIEHRDIHNIYGFLHTMSTHEGLMKRDNNATRPFILTRSHFAGSQRYAAMWTGDNTPDWDHLKNSYSECMLSNLVGLVFCGADIPGFFKTVPKPTDQFVYRAYQAGIWLPFFRGHASNDTESREPYSYGGKPRDLIRNAIKMRYRHIPTWYQLFYEHTQTGAPVIRPLFYEFPGEIEHNDHIMIGRGILARPVFDEDVKEVTVHLPGKDEKWYRIDGNSVQAYNGDQEVTINVEKGESPAFYRGGSIIVTRDRDVMSTEDGKRLPVTVYVNLNKDLKATGKLYNDDGVSFEYKNNKKLYVKLSFTEEHMLQVEPIGEQKHDGLEVVIEKIVVNDWNRTHVSTHHQADVGGNFLSHINIIHALRNNENKMIYKLRR